MLNIKEICQAYQELIVDYQKALNQYSEADFQLKKAEEVWSLGQMYEHLYSSHSFFIYQVKNCLAQRKGQIGGEKTEIGENIYKYGTFPPIKVTIPEKYRGPEPIAKPRTAYAEMLETMQTDFQALVEPLEQDSGAYKTQHARFGMLNAVEWYKSAEMHLRHHLRQKQELEDFAYQIK
jgi:hypothetical protein